MIDCLRERQKDESLAAGLLRIKTDISLTLFSFSRYGQMTLSAQILLEIAPLARPSHRWWASGGWSSWRFCLFDVRRRLAFDRIRLRAGFRGRIRVDRTAGPDPRETHGKIHFDKPATSLRNIDALHTSIILA
jgi:hypothetical protein